MIGNNIIHRNVLHALFEDTDKQENFSNGDLTSLLFIPENLVVRFNINTRTECRLAGLDFAKKAFQLCDHRVKFHSQFNDGDILAKGETIATVSGNARGLLTAERTALNFLQHLSGIATVTAQYVDAIKHTQAILLDTRKTTPQLRIAEKYAVRCGGGKNHRMGLYDAIMIKDNHAAISGYSFKTLIEKGLHQQNNGIKIIVECDNLEQFKIVNDFGIKHILLDNMHLDQLAYAVAHKNNDVKLEASGNVNLTNITAIAETGVNYISTSKITQGASPIDIGLDYD